MIALLTGMAFGLLGLAKYVPDFLIRAFDSAGKCQGHVAISFDWYLRKKARRNTTLFDLVKFQNLHGFLIKAV